jgi:hypothetical protein
VEPKKSAMSVEYIFVFPFDMRQTQRGMQGHRQQDEIFPCSHFKKNMTLQKFYEAKTCNNFIHYIRICYQSPHLEKPFCANLKYEFSMTKKS